MVENADQDRQNAMRDRGYGDLEQRLWAIIDRDGLGDVPSDIVGAVARLAAIAAQVERDQAELARLMGGWEEATIAWAVCASIHREYAKRKDALFTTRQADFVKHEQDARRQALPTTTAPQQAEPRLPDSVASESAMERAKAAWLRISWGTQNTLPQWQVNEISTVFATAITEAEQAARARAVARAILFVADEAWGLAAQGDAPPEVCLAIEALSDDPEIRDRLANKILADILEPVLAAKPPQPQKPEE